ncbi:hypothetical protein A3F27_00645 [Candidatus Kaiserbacteria bacterium RIFCSPHIGHO2_12_FULL_53_13]|uniref:2TM domain-containing protein n=1 Tax=Candidatus Kaiserbacteria bacterium RIFCSPHIGHO2_12_FULL_53_13 TaxID=1798502 RepID=A0A1F6ECB5_9BACT|nr:MAG: hypothetical protein A3F27_00645 [Candidatus Kaiserbacteria bacterium RIFCSPHIGHO2_12_FULL_53_13]
MNEELEDLQKELKIIQDRNQRVEAEKAWETSTFRVGSIALITFLTATYVLYVVGNDHPWRNALIPTIGFILSTQSLPFLRTWWVSRYVER